MKRIFFKLFVLIIGLAQGQVGIGTTSPNASAILDVTSTTKGLLLPRLTTVQRDAIVSPEAGLLIYNTTTKKINIFVGAGWDELNTTATYGSIASIDCDGATAAGSLYAGTAASGVTSTVAYTGGNGMSHSGQVVASTGVTGLTATVTAGNFASGNGTLVYAITGTPNSSGTANFSLNIGGQVCTLQIGVSPWSAGYVHCGGTPTTVVEVVSAATGRIWMDKNLGATQVATSATDALAYGDLFQWGRGADGHQCRNSSTTSTTSSSDQVGNSSFILTTGVPNANPPVAPYNDWRSPQNDNLWQGVAGVNNPCPYGFRLPTSAELNAELVSLSTADNLNLAYQTNLKFTANGIRSNSNGSFSFTGSRGTYWSSTISGVSAINVFWNNTIKLSDSSSGRGLGAAVRCIKN